MWPAIKKALLVALLLHDFRKNDKCLRLVPSIIWTQISVSMRHKVSHKSRE